MVPTPVFVPSFEELISHVRLTKALCCDDLEMVVARAVIATRLQLYKELGETRINDLLTFTRTEEPTTAEERSRMCAELLEVERVRLELIQSLPVLVGDNSQAQQTWNQLDPMLRGPASERDRLMSEARERIENYLCCARAVDTNCAEEGDGTSFTTDPGESCYPCGIGRRYSHSCGCITETCTCGC